MGKEEFSSITLQKFFTELFCTLKKILKVEKHEIPGITAQGGSSFPLSSTILAGSLDTAHTGCQIKDVVAKKANDYSLEKKDQEEANGNNLKHCRNKIIDYSLKDE